MANNITLTGQWTPIPQLGPNGVLDGNGMTISGLNISNRTIAQTGVNVGLFAVNNGLIKNLTMHGFDIRFNIDMSATWSNVGSVVGLNHGVISHVTARGFIEVSRVNTTIGGIAGRNEGGAVLYSEIGLDATIVLAGNGDIGGVVGANMNQGTVILAITRNALILHYWFGTNRSVGGVVGYNSFARLQSVAVFDTVIRYTNSASADNRRPHMGMILGRLSHSILWYYTQANVALDPGTLTVAQRVNFGATRWWPWGGSETPVGTNDIR